MNSVWEHNISTSGAPDIYCARRLKDGSIREFRAEVKYCDTEPKSLRTLWNMLRKNQQQMIPRLAYASSSPVYLITCVAGQFALWHKFDQDRCGLVRAGKIPPWECLVLLQEMRRTREGKWHLLHPADPKGRVNA